MRGDEPNQHHAGIESVVVKDPVEINGRLCRILFLRGRFTCQLWENGVWSLADPVEILITATSISRRLYARFGLASDGERSISEESTSKDGKLLTFYKIASNKGSA